jgi:hypothetical protein
MLRCFLVHASRAWVWFVAGVAILIDSYRLSAADAFAAWLSTSVPSDLERSWSAWTPSDSKATGAGRANPEEPVLDARPTALPACGHERRACPGCAGRAP